MAAAKSKTFRIEARHNGVPAPVQMNGSSHGGSFGGHHEILEAIADLKMIVSPQDDTPAELVERYRSELDEARRIKSELDDIQFTIADTKKEIASLHCAGFGEENLDTVSNQLDAVVDHTEKATESILAAAEIIDGNASNLAAALKGPENEMASDIQDQVVQIFEACNFQDITGQRITKVVETLNFIERRVNHMMDIWGGIESFQGVEPVRPDRNRAHEELLNGPGFDEDPDTASQDDIDALFD